jgi:hypothetical protein
MLKRTGQLNGRIQTIHPLLSGRLVQNQIENIFFKLSKPKNKENESTFYIVDVLHRKKYAGNQLCFS